MMIKPKFSNISPDGYMNEAQRATLKLSLSQWRRQLLEEEINTAIVMGDGSANDADPIDRATQTEELLLELATRSRRSRLINKIDHSIVLIDNDDYGYCGSCGIEIGLLRMQARPTATQCIDCKSLGEMKERQERG
jgi:DnaK suppressor protein